MSTTVKFAIEEFLQVRLLSNVSDGTLRLYRHRLNVFSSRVPEHLSEIQVSDLRSFFLYLRDERVPHADSTRRPAAVEAGVSAHTLDGYFRLLSSFWRWCDGEGYLTDTQRQFFRRGRMPRPRVEQEIRPVYDDGDIDALLDACANDERPESMYRDRAILLMLLESGMRVVELCSLTDETVELKNQRARIRGKGGKYRWVFWHQDTAKALMYYLEWRRGERGGPLFRSVWGDRDGSISPEAVRSLMRRLSDRSGVTLPPGAPIHALRHTFAHRALDAGLDISQVSQLLGHSSIEVTMRYLREHPGRLQEVHRKIFEQLELGGGINSQ